MFSGLDCLQTISVLFIKLLENCHGLAAIRNSFLMNFVMISCWAILSLHLSVISQ